MRGILAAIARGWWSKRMPPEAPSDVWVELATGDRLDLTPVYVGKSDGLHHWTVAAPKDFVKVHVGILPPFTAVTLTDLSIGNVKMRRSD